jgi:hypothetical protein
MLGILAFGFFAAAVLWHLTLGQTLTQRIPPGWSWKSSYIGFENYPDPQTGRFAAENRIAIYDREMTIHSAGNRSGSVVLSDAYVTADPKTGEIKWKYIVFPEIDPRSGLHLSDEHRQHHVVLPQGLKKQAYSFRQNYIKGVQLRFLGEDTIEGLPVYVYSYKGPGEYTEFYVGDESNPGINVPPGHEIRCADDQFSFFIWAEPITGEAVKIKESCYSGDYMYDLATGRTVAPILRWSAETAGIDVVRRAEVIRDRILELRAARYAPFGLAALGLICAAGAVRLRLRRS